MKRMNGLGALLGAALLALLVGCGSKNDGPKTFAEMSSDDIIVQVNSNILRKADLERFWRMNVAYVSQLRGNERMDAQRRIRADMVASVPQFVDQMLLVDDAKRCKVLAETQVVAQVERAIDMAAKAKKMTRQQFLTMFPDAEWLARTTAERRIWINAHVAANIPPAVEVTGELVTNYVNFISAELTAVKATNAMHKAALARYRRDFAADVTGFTNEAARVSEDTWDVGLLERMQIDWGAEVRDQVFAVKAGMMLEPFEDDDFYRLICVADVIAPVKDEKGRLIEPEKRRLYQIAFRKEDEPVKVDYAEAAHVLYVQFRDQAIRARIDCLKTNGENTVVWPNGTNIWRRVK